MATRIQKFATDNVTPLPGRIFGTIVLVVTEDCEKRLNEEQPLVVCEYVARKLRESGDRTIKVGRTVTRQNGEFLEGTFHWSLRGEFYDQLAVWDPTSKQWFLVQP